MKEFGGSERQQMSVHSAASRASASVHIAQSLDAAVNKLDLSVMKEPKSSSCSRDAANTSTWIQTGLNVGSGLS